MTDRITLLNEVWHLAEEYSKTKNHWHDQILFDLAIKKQQTLDFKRKAFAGSNSVEVCLIDDPPNHSCIAEEPPSRTRIKLTELEKYIEEVNVHNDYFKILIITNNTIAKLEPNFIHRKIETKHNLFLVAHDYDSHHWATMSTRCAILADLYVPAHYAAPDYLLHFLPYPLCSVPIGTILWPRAFLIKHINQIIDAKRPEVIAGYFSLYQKFTLRNKQIMTFHNHFKSVTFVDTNGYIKKSEEEKLDQWLAAKIQLIIPVGLDIPIRFFDALATGALPAVPIWLVNDLDRMGIPPEFYVSYSLSDLVHPEKLAVDWECKFDKLGPKGITDRVLYAISKLHGDKQVDKIQTIALKLLKSH
ncbi:MAG: hypothetical protein EBV12_07700 [Betaproteobacteria bacterium]|nr:hypothetical protein [Betaproteobacteria bacterium]